jgi:hypothetical protein
MPIHRALFDLSVEVRAVLVVYHSLAIGQRPLGGTGGQLLAQNLLLALDDRHGGASGGPFLLLQLFSKRVAAAHLGRRVACTLLGFYKSLIHSNRFASMGFQRYVAATRKVSFPPVVVASYLTPPEPLNSDAMSAKHAL